MGIIAIYRSRLKIIQAAIRFFKTKLAKQILTEFSKRFVKYKVDLTTIGLKD